jgi:hypothetical protein
MPSYKYTRDEFEARKQQRINIYTIVFEFVELSDDYWIDFKKLRKVLKKTENLEAFLSGFLDTKGKFNAQKLSAFNQMLEEKHARILLQNGVFAAIQENTTSKGHEEELNSKHDEGKHLPSMPKPQEDSSIEENADKQPRKRIKRVRLTPEQKAELEKLKLNRK